MEAHRAKATRTILARGKQNFVFMREPQKVKLIGKVVAADGALPSDV
jgi:hypothetical protein